MHLYLCALKFYKTAIFSSKRTFTSFVPWLITPVDNSTFISGIFAGEINDSIEKAFWVEGLRKFPLKHIDEYVDAQRGDEKSGRSISVFQEIEKVDCITKKIDTGKYQVQVKGKPKYMRDFVLEYQENISMQHKKMIFILSGDIHIEDFVSDTFDAGKMKQRMNFVSKVVKKF